MTVADLYRWSTAAQLVSVLMIALFYLALARTLRRSEVEWWAEGWAFNFAALVVTVSYWFFVPSREVALVIRGLYVGGKIAYAVLLVQGARAFLHPGSSWLTRRAIMVAMLGAALIGASLLTSIARIGVFTQGSMGVLFIWCGATLLQSRALGITWLGVGFVLRGSLAVVESAAYAADMLPPGALSQVVESRLSLFLGIHSSIDLAGEWLLALGGVMALTQRTQRELSATNTDLLGVQEELRRLADRDPLTGLANRRALPGAFRDVFDTGATLAFFDLDGFKAINDTRGHAEGDAHLIRFAEALRASFRPGDSIVRYAGDEFVVVAGGMSMEMASERVERLRSAVDVGFSVGLSELQPSGNAEAALKEADAAMYAVKVAKG